MHKPEFLLENEKHNPLIQTRITDLEWIKKKEKKRTPQPTDFSVPVEIIKKKGKGLINTQIISESLT